MTKKAASPPGQIETHGAPGAPDFLGQFLPPELLAKLQAMRAHGGMAGERRVITMLFCDVKGSTAAAEQVDPEVWTEIMNGAFERMIGPIYRYEGTVPRLMGDAILAFFGAPIAHEDDPQRAVWAGLDIQAAMTPYAAEIKSQHRLDIGLRVGINTGLVVVGEIGSDLRMEYTAIGDAVNLAARMEQTAAPGTVQITEDTRRLVAPLFDLEPLGRIEIKGKSEPIAAYRVIGRKAEPGPLRGLEGISSPLVGREAELQLLRERLDALKAGSGSFVTVVGEAGLGKSSLVAEVQKQPSFAGQQAEILWVKGESLAHARSVSYFPWRQIIRRSIEARDDDPQAAVRGKLRHQCECCKLPGGDMPFLEAMLAVESEQSLRVVADYQGEALVERMTDAVYGYLCGLASMRPLALVFDDLHWADEASLALLLSASSLMREHPILFICLLRPDQQAPSWRSIQAVETQLGAECMPIHLEPLGAAQTDVLLSNLLAMKDLPASLRDVIKERAGGNPFFIEELIRSLIETGQIVRENNHWRVASREASVRLPDTLRGVLGARIDRLPESGRHILQMASVIGRTFDVRVLGQLAGGDGLDESVAMLVQAGLLEASAAGEGASLVQERTFRHVLIQEAAYESILLKKRAGLHRQAAEALEELHPNRLEEFAPVLAHHFREAHDDRSLRYDTLSGDKAAKLFANAEAATHYRYALETAKRLGIDAAGMSDLYTRLGGVLELSGRYHEALSTYEEMRQWAKAVAVPAAELQALMAKGTIYSTPTAMRDEDLSESTMLEALDLSRSIADIGMQAKLTWTMMLNYLHSRRIKSAYEYGQRALALAEEAGDQEQLAFVLNDLGRVMVCLGEFEGALDVIRQAHEIFGQLKNRVMQADNLGAQEEALYSMGRFRDVLQVGPLALEICEELDNAWGRSYHRLLMGLAQFELGEHQAAIRLMEEAVEMGDQGGLIISTIAGRCDLAWSYGATGQIDKALELVDSALEAARQTLPDWVAMPAAVKIRLHGLRGDRLAAEAAAMGVELKRPTLAYPHYSMMVELARVELARLRGDYDTMLVLVDSMLEEMERLLPAEAPRLVAYREQALRALGREPRE